MLQLLATCRDHNSSRWKTRLGKSRMRKQTHFLPSSSEGRPCLALSQAGNTYRVRAWQTVLDSAPQVSPHSIQPPMRHLTCTSVRTRRALLHHVRREWRRTIRRSRGENATEEVRYRTVNRETPSGHVRRYTDRAHEEASAHAHQITHA